MVQVRTELSAGADGELAVDASQVGLDRLGADEQRRGDVLVAHSGGRQFGDALFGRDQDRSRARCCPRERGAGTRGPQGRSHLLERRQRSAQRRFGGLAAALPTLEVAQQ